PVVADYRIIRSRVWSGARFFDLVLQAAGQRDYTFFTFVRGQKRFPCFLVCVGCFFILLLHLGLHLFLDLRDRGLRLLVGKQRLAAGKSVLDATRHNGGVHRHRLLLEICSHFHSDGVTEFFFLRLQGQGS